MSKTVKHYAGLLHMAPQVGAPENTPQYYVYQCCGSLATHSPFSQADFDNVADGYGLCVTERAAECLSLRKAH